MTVTADSLITNVMSAAKVECKLWVNACFMCNCYEVHAALLCLLWG